MEDETNVSGILDRLRLGTNAKSDVELGRKLGVGQQSVSNARASGKVPDAWLRKAVTELGLSADWLLLGVGSMQIGASSEKVVEDHSPQTIDAPSHEIIMIPMVEARLSAGCGSFETDATSERQYSFRSDFLRRKGNVSKMVLMRVAGDSMFPTVEDGDIVLIDQSQNKPVPGKIYAVGVEDMVFLKRLHAEPGKLVLLSDNKTYPPLEVDTRGDLENNAHVIGRVIWCGREM